MAGESYTSPVTGETYTVPKYTDPADAPIAFKDFADTITGLPALDPDRVGQVVQSLDGAEWYSGMALQVLGAVPADTEGQVGDVVFVTGPSPGNIQGKILQVVSATTSTSVSSSSSTFVDTGLTATITPTLATSTVLVLVSQNGLFKYAGDISSAISLQLLRTATVITADTMIGYTETSSYNAPGSWSVGYRDSPATDAAVTYKTQFANRVAAAQVIVQYNSATSTIILMEVAA